MDLYKNKTKRFCGFQVPHKGMNHRRPAPNQPASTYQMQLLADGTEIVPPGQGTKGIRDLS